MRPDSGSRRHGPRPKAAFLADEMWSLSDNRHFAWFCESAYLVDEYEQLTDAGVPTLALATHLPSEVDPLDPAADEDLDDCICVRFTALDAGNASRPLWRCDITWARRPGYRFSVAGGYDDQLLRHLQDVELLLLVKASVWDWWQLADAYLVVPNDRDLWLTCTT